MEAWQQRAIADRDELDQRLIAMEAFRECDKFKALPDIDQKLLIEQEAHMAGYSAVLSKRIARF